MLASALNPLDDLGGVVAIVCHDAGAANLIISWVKALQSSGVEFRACMQGPAARLWDAAFPGSRNLNEPVQALHGARVLVSGTGWASEVEHMARVLAKTSGQRSVAVLDHWVNYAARFERHGQVAYPDEFWVTDEQALSEAQRCFPNRTVRQFSNQFLMDEVHHIRSADQADSTHVLYVLEPARNTWGREQQGEFQALDYFEANRTKLGLGGCTTVCLRPHPSDPPNKYASWAARARKQCTDVHFIFDESASLSDAISKVGWVAGCESFALVVALAAGRQVVCTLPPWAPACRLPQPGLIHLSTLPEPK